MMQIAVAYAGESRRLWLKLEVAEGCTVYDAIERSGILAQLPGLDLETQKVGVYGKVVPLDAPLREGDRVEIYRAITCDPKTVPRRQGAEDD
ncbi:RnfH family protein [Niveibacterium terrae]|uniref:RnfH family protein n=1 Tax=Niveibacterium terrae TaxID=3373598 RepID=UPI003A9524E1